MVQKSRTTIIGQKHPFSREFNTICYPNPAQDILYLKDPQNMAAFNLYSLSGILARSYSPVTRPQIASAELPAGLYIAEAQYKNGAVQRQKLLIHR
ncbi:T9SS C-terminal target domain-containing protein [Sphingobacteriales bacterium UPWRP_1]|nr:hypothetical protein BVG80_10005 [Sphingobacteriales bacterium TSM_CSM]PSJ76313.1 T9SS C-terminal target domain-containing protein [Sphingobacteriales bacterium UPWRP_1]